MPQFTNFILLHKVGCLVNNSASKFAARRNIHRYVAPTLREINKRIGKAEPLPVEKSKRSNFIEWNFNAELFAFGKRLGEEFRIETLTQSFVHRSYIVQEELKQEQLGIESPNLSLKDNEQLAKVGEDIICSYVNKFLSFSFPRLPREGIQSLQDYLLSDATLAHISKNLGTTDIILAAEYPIAEETYAKTLKAIIGALSVSQSTERAELFVRDFILTQLAEKDINDLYIVPEPLSTLEKILTADGRGPPEPRLIGQSAMNDILANYTVGMYSDKILIGQGPGETIDIAVEMAARDSLKRLFLTSDSSTPLRFDIDQFNVTSDNLPLAQWKETAFRTA